MLMSICFWVLLKHAAAGHSVNRARSWSGPAVFSLTGALKLILTARVLLSLLVVLYDTRTVVMLTT